ncbi:hypothetical protein L1887_21978 [Cichorium endivia]|nr:hypothetical protein L1887_21978 [Cichorium endivia]
MASPQDHRSFSGSIPCVRSFLCPPMASVTAAASALLIEIYEISGLGLKTMRLGFKQVEKGERACEEVKGPATGGETQRIVILKRIDFRLEDCDGLFDCALLMIEKKNPNPDTLEDCDSPART